MQIHFIHMYIERTGAHLLFSIALKGEERTDTHVINKSDERFQYTTSIIIYIVLPVRQTN